MIQGFRIDTGGCSRINSSTEAIHRRRHASVGRPLAGVGRASGCGHAIHRILKLLWARDALDISVISLRLPPTRLHHDQSFQVSNVDSPPIMLASVFDGLDLGAGFSKKGQYDGQGGFDGSKAGTIAFQKTRPGWYEGQDSGRRVSVTPMHRRIECLRFHQKMISGREQGRGPALDKFRGKTRLYVRKAGE